MSLTTQSAIKSDTTEISLFIKDVYDHAVAPTYSEEGNQEFYKYINVEAIEKRFDNDHWMLKALDGDSLVGIIEIRKNEHLSMLFVERLHQKTLTVHSTPNAVAAYQKLGFQVKSEEQNVNGIRFVTMEKILT